MIVNQYRPQRPSNELHALTLMRMEARKDADAAYKQLQGHVSRIMNPQPAKSGIVGAITSNLTAIISGIAIGKKIVAAIRK